VLLATRRSARVRTILFAGALTALLAAPATWAVETIGNATNGTFPTGGPASAAQIGGGGPGRFGAGPRGPGGFPGPAGFGPPGGAPSFGGAPGAFGGNSAALNAAIRYAGTHGGGTIGVSSQSSAAPAIVAKHANVAGLGGFSGRESAVSVTWLAARVRTGHLRWVLVDDNRGASLPGDTRTGSQTALNAVAKACRAVTVATGSGSSLTMYDCLGRSAAILQAGAAR
jgi:hypothetical protein